MSGVESPRLGIAEPGWPQVTVIRELGSDADPKPPGTVDVADDAVTVWLMEGGRIDLRRDGLQVRMLTPRPISDEAVLHPYFALPAAFVGLWLGRHALHGGAFVHGDGAWALLADKGGGKSSTLGALLRRDHVIVTDDILVLEGRDLFAGPRAVDLREEAAGVLGGEALGIVGARERFRLQSGPAPSTSPLRGAIELVWGDEMSLTKLDANERLLLLIEHSVLRPFDADALRLLDLAALPAWRFTRPRDVAQLEPCVDQLLASLPG